MYVQLTICLCGLIQCLLAFFPFQIHSSDLFTLDVIDGGKQNVVHNIYILSIWIQDKSMDITNSSLIWKMSNSICTFFFIIHVRQYCTYTQLLKYGLKVNAHNVSNFFSLIWTYNHWFWYWHSTIDKWIYILSFVFTFSMSHVWIISVLLQ